MNNEIHLFLDWCLLVIGTSTAFAGLNLAEIDLILAIVLKIVSIISFTTLIIINWKKIKTFVKK